MDSINEILEAEKLIHDITECDKKAGMLTNFQNEVESISKKAKKKLATAQGIIDTMKQSIKSVFGKSRSSSSEQQCALGKIECLTFRIVMTTKKFKAALKFSCESIKNIEERKKRLNFAGSLPKTVAKKPGDYTIIPTRE